MEDTTREYLKHMVLEHIQENPKLMEDLRQAAYRSLGLTYDEHGQGYWTRGLARLRQAGAEIPKPPRRFPLIVLGNQ